MRSLKVAGLVMAAVLCLPAGVAAAAPKDYCADLKGVSAGQLCQIQQSDPGYTLNISFPISYPDQKGVADYITQTRDAFLNVAKSSAQREAPYTLEITPTNYGSAIPPRGTQATVFKTTQNVGGAHPQTTFKAFNWDQTYRKPIIYATAKDDDKNQPLWAPTAPDPLKTVFPIVQTELQKQAGPQVAISPAAGLDPQNYQQFAITNEGVIFFFSQGTLLPEAAGATQVLVPRSAIDPMLA